MKHGCCNDKVCTRDTCMNLPAGETCADCGFFAHCKAMYGMKAKSTNCDFFPRRFSKSNK
jgi:hypothetical protein